MKICLITPTWPSFNCGIGDYSAHVAQALSLQDDVTVLTAERGVATPVAGVEVKAIFNPSNLNEVYRIADYVENEKPDWVLLQYNPYSFHARGLNLHLPLMMQTLKKRSPGTKIAVMVHEARRPIESWRHALSTSWIHWSLSTIGRAADVLFFSIDPWVKKYQSWFPNTLVLHLPVGSNIPVVNLPKQEAKRRLGLESDCLTLGIFGRVQPSLSPEHIKDAVGSVKGTGIPHAVLYVGSQGAYVSSQLPGSPMIADGPLAPEEVSRRFQAMDCMLLPFVEGVSTRRTSLMTALQHGVAVVGTWGALTDKMLLKQNPAAMLLAPAGNREEYKRNMCRLAADAPLREQVGTSGHRFYEENFSWEVIIQRLRAVMEARA